RNRAKNRWQSWRGEPGLPWSGGLRLIGVHREPLRGGERDGQGFVVADRDEAPGGAVEAHHDALVDVDEPAMQRNFATRDTGGDRRMGAQMCELDDDILEACGADQTGVVEVGIAR